jgi:hypothetical protein
VDRRAAAGGGEGDGDADMGGGQRSGAAAAAADSDDEPTTPSRPSARGRGADRGEARGARRDRSGPAARGASRGAEGPRGAGDARRRGQRLDPFAYVPLDPRALSGKHGARAVGRFAGVAGSTMKRGASQRARATERDAKRRR